MKFFSYTGAVLLPTFAASLVSGIQFNPDDENSIKAATKQYAYGLMSYYKNNASGTAKEDIGIFPKPVYWWEAGAAWGGLVEYSTLTGDASHVKTLNQALVANQGPANDLIMPNRKDQEGNDDQAFWAFAYMSALEYQFPDSDGYLQVVENAFNNIISRWDTAACNGGLKWQIYPENAYGYFYKNSISNGATFALAARLARYTGNQTYADWATKIFTWSKDVGLISDKYEVFDGTDEKKNCSEQDHTEWSYNLGVYLHGAATLYDFTKGSDTWKQHTSGLLSHASTFFKPFDNATDIMFEAACETGTTGRTCNLDQQSFKAYLARFLAKTAVLAPFTKDKVSTWLRTSAVAAAKSCSGDANACGSKWYVGGFDGASGIGQQLSALEVTQALLTLKNNVSPVKIGDAKPSPSSSAAPSSTQAPSTAKASVISTIVPGSSAAAQASASIPASSSGAGITSITKVSAASSAPTSPATSQAGGDFHENISSSSDSTCTVHTTYTTVYVAPTPTPTPSTLSTTCVTPSATVTVYIPPTAVPTSNGTIPHPPTNTTSPVPEFTGAGASTKTTVYSILVAGAVAFFSGLL